jgi:hypothetical protein
MQYDTRRRRTHMGISGVPMSLPVREAARKGISYRARKTQILLKMKIIQIEGKCACGVCWREDNLID